MVSTALRTFLVTGLTAAAASVGGEVVITSNPATAQEIRIPARGEVFPVSALRVRQVGCGSSFYKGEQMRNGPRQKRSAKQRNKAYAK